MAKRTIDAKTLDEVGRFLSVDLGASQAADNARQMRTQIDNVFGVDFTDDFCKALSVVIGVDIITSPDNPLNVACKDQAEMIIEQEKIILDLRKEIIELRSRSNFLQEALCAVRKIVKCQQISELEEEARKLRDISKPNLHQRIILNCHEKFRDILIRTKGC